jgi:NADH-quinone oxidoreductase subunit J
MYIALRAQYLAYVFLIVYVGAVAILFLFVVMLLNVKALYSKGSLITSVGQVAGILVCVLLSYHLVEVLSAGFYTFTPSLVAGMPKLAPFTVDALVYAVGSASDILGFSALFEARAAALLIIILFILLAAMLGAIIQATKSMEVGTPNFKNLEVYTETVAVAKGFISLPRYQPYAILSRGSLRSR